MEKIPISSLRQDPSNARKHSKKNLSAIKGSLKKFGQQKPIVITHDGVVIAGNGTLEAAKSLGWSEIGVVWSALSGSDLTAYAIADNRSGELAEWDLNILPGTLEALSKEFDLEEIGFDKDDLAKLIKEEVKEGLTDDDEIPEQVETRCKPGDLWILGEHRLLCGDSTDVLQVERLMGGAKADMVFTDPPYNTGMTPNNGSTRLNHMFNDSFTDEEWQDFMSSFCSNYYLLMAENSTAYVCLDWRRNHELVPHLKKHFKLSNIIIWDKMVHGLGSDYKYTYELMNVCKKGKPKLDTHQGDDREYSDVWHIQRKMGKDEDHATKKPIELVERALRHASTSKSLIADLFLGSGSTLIACEKTGRKCFGMELDPKYCDVILTRWEKFAGETATLSTEI